MTFKEHYLQDRLFLIEVSKRTLMRKTDKKRVKRALEEVQIKNQRIVEVDGNGLMRLEYRVKSNPSTEKKSHWGYIEFTENNKSISKAWCSCRDFAYRLWAPYVESDLSNWDLINKYKKREKERQPYPHTQEWTIETNPSGKMYTCKHLYKIMTEL